MEAEQSTQTPPQKHHSASRLRIQYDLLFHAPARVDCVPLKHDPT